MAPPCGEGPQATAPTAARTLLVLPKQDWLELLTNGGSALLAHPFTLDD